MEAGDIRVNHACNPRSDVSASGRAPGQPPGTYAEFIGENLVRSGALRRMSDHGKP